MSSEKTMRGEPLPLYLDAPLEFGYDAATGELTLGMSPMLPVELAQSIPSPRLRLRLSKAALSQLLRCLQTHPELTETLAGSSDGSPSDATH